MTDLVKIKEEINLQLGDKETFATLVATTFKGLEVTLVKRAVMEGMMRGFTFKDFLEKNVYAIPFKGGYSLVTSVDYARKLGMRSGIVGKSAPSFTLDEKGIESCTVTVKKQANGYIGDFTATVFFAEYFKAGYGGKPSLWETKPRTMIAKVAEMHALRMACPEELAQVYVEEEYQQEAVELNTVDPKFQEEIDAIDTIEQLQEYYKANKGAGKDFDKYVTKRKKELQATQNEIS
jgi:hypothetical protein